MVPEGQLPDGQGDGWGDETEGEPPLDTGLPDSTLEPESFGISDAFVPGLNFEGIAFTTGWPPDTVGDVGPNHYIQMVNASVFQIWDKSGNSLAGPTQLDTLWTIGGNCANGRGDPIVLYDHLANRWLMSEFAGSGLNHLCIYISKTADPVSGGWWLYDFTTPTVADYPKYALWPDAYYASTYEGSTLGVYALDRTQMLSGNPATFQRFSISSLTPQSGFRDTRILPADLDGPVPPSSSPNYFFRSVEASQDISNPVDRLEVYEFDVDFVTPANSTFTLVNTLAPANFSMVTCSPGTRDCIPQPGTTRLLDALSNRPMSRLQYRNFGTHQALVTNQTVDAGRNVAGVRFWELRKGTSWSIFQQGTYSPDSNGRWMGSIAMDGDGNMALGYSVSSSSVFPGIRYTGRLASDPLGTMPQGESTIINGTGSQTVTQRWGDYSAMSVDPADDCTFWYTQEYIPAGGNWRTRVASFSFSECGVPPVAVHDCVIDAQLDRTLTGPFTLDCSNGAITNSGTLVPTSGPVPGAFYWQMSPFIDIIEVGFEAHSNQWLLHGKWEVSGSYLLPIAGNLSLDDQGVWRLGVHGTVPPSEIGAAGPNTAISN
jgi:hypothetical protein